MPFWDLQQPIINLIHLHCHLRALIIPNIRHNIVLKIHPFVVNSHYPTIIHSLINNFIISRNLQLTHLPSISIINIIQIIGVNIFPPFTSICCDSIFFLLLNLPGPSSTRLNYIGSNWSSFDQICRRSGFKYLTLFSFLFILCAFL